MKKVRRAVLLTVTAAVLLAACSGAASEKVDSGEIVVPEMSSEELLASSLEYLLQDETDETDETEETEAISGNNEDKTQEEVSDDKEEAGKIPVAEERVPKENEAVIYYGNAGSYDLSRELVTVEEKTAEELLDALARHNIVSLDTKVLSFEEKEDDGVKVLYLELSKAAGEYLKTMSREAECIILASVVDTFLENFGADKVYIAVDGKPLKTKNAEYEEALTRCTPEELLEQLGANAAENVDTQEEEETKADETVSVQEDGTE